MKIAWMAGVAASFLIGSSVRAQALGSLPPPVPQESPGATVPARPATSAAPMDAQHRHLGGFFRPDAGFGYFTTSASQNGTDARLSGIAGTFGLAAGGAISENSILAFHVWDAVVSDPSFTLGTSSGSLSGTVALFGIGPEYTVYSAQNYYFSISPSLTRMSVSNGSSSADTNLGFGLRAAVGKEWWVSDHWGMGLAGQASMSVNDDSGTNPPTWMGWALTLAFSATYN